MQGMQAVGLGAQPGLSSVHHNLLSDKAGHQPSAFKSSVPHRDNMPLAPPQSMSPAFYQMILAQTGYNQSQAAMQALRLNEQLHRPPTLSPVSVTSSAHSDNKQFSPPSDRESSPEPDSQELHFGPEKDSTKDSDKTFVHERAKKQIKLSVDFLVGK